MSEADTPKPLVSVVIPCYNHEKYVQECIKSVIEQDYENIELIIIDDGSKDESVSKIQELVPECEKRFSRFEFRTRPNKGLCATLNEAIAWCEGAFYSAIASDDMMLPGKTSLQVEYFQKHPECDAVFGGMYVVDNNGEVVKKIKKAQGTANFEDIITKKVSITTPTQMIKLEKLRLAGEYPSGLYIEDWYMWLKLSSLGANICFLEEYLVTYRRHGENMSSNFENMFNARDFIINQYKSSPVYKKALSSCFLSNAIDMQSINKSKSIFYFFRALSTDFLIFFNIRTIKYFAKFLKP